MEIRTELTHPKHQYRTIFLKKLIPLCLKIVLNVSKMKQKLRAKILESSQAWHLNVFHVPCSRSKLDTWRDWLILSRAPGTKTPAVATIKEDNKQSKKSRWFSQAWPKCEQEVKFHLDNKPHLCYVKNYYSFYSQLFKTFFFSKC